MSVANVDRPLSPFRMSSSTSVTLPTFWMMRFGIQMWPLHSRSRLSTWARGHGSRRFAAPSDALWWEH